MDITQDKSEFPQPSSSMRGQRIVVAMSGGVDSSVVAALLKHQGYDVIGITLQLYDNGRLVGRKGACCAGQDIYDARKVADLLSIPHYVLNYEERFAKKVIQPFAQSYLKGETPIPCVTCNQEIKFKDLLQTALELDADKLATGHYIQLQETLDGPILSRARDAERDQSYFLYSLEHSHLKRLLFPLGPYLKSEVRDMARQFQLPIAEKADSQDICFVHKGHYAEVIEKLKPGALSPGDIIDVKGQKIGKHDGIVHYTVGQRKGIGISSPEPLYVLSLNVDSNQIVVGPRHLLHTSSLLLRDINWLDDAPLEETVRQKRRVYVRVRSSQPPQPAVLTKDEEGRIGVLFCQSQGAASPGQACVFYCDDTIQSRVLGGGIITKQILISPEDRQMRPENEFMYPTSTNETVLPDSSKVKAHMLEERGS